MAVITSAASGNFSAGATWVGGVAPVDGDNFIIAAPHIVTVDSGITVPANGYNDSTINGLLQHTTSGISSIRMNGVLTVGAAGTYHMRGDATLDFKGTLADNHGLTISNTANSSFIAEGADGMPSTTLTTGISEGSTTLTVASASNFAPGEWIAVYNNTTAQTGNGGNTTLRDEGFWIHDISGGTIYFRQYVGPESTVVSGENNILYVTNAKVFRENQKIIFGTGINRNVHTITAINYGANQLTLSGNIVGLVDGLTVYETGTDKIHGANDKVRKVATVTTVATVSTASTITVANANMFAAGDEIWVEARSEAGGTTDGGWNAYTIPMASAAPGVMSNYVKTVQSVSGNSITLTGAVGYNVVSGALVTRLTRRVQIRAISDNDFFYWFMNFFNSNYTRKLVFKDVYLRRCGTDGQAPGRGIEMRGHSSTNALPVTLTETVPAWNQQPWIEGVVLSGSQRQPDIGGFFLWDMRYAQARCCFVTRTFDGFGCPWYNAGQAIYNSITTGNSRWAFRSEGGNESYEIAYNYGSRCYHHFRMIMPYETGYGYHHNITDAANEYAYSTLIGLHGPAVYKHKHTGIRYGVNTEGYGFTHLIDSSLKFLSGLTLPSSPVPGTPQAGWFYLQMDRGQNSYGCTTIYGDDFEYDRVRQFGYNTERIWDPVEDAWRVYNRFDGADYGSGWSESVFVPAGTTVRAKCLIKLAPNYSGNLPRFEARSTQGQFSPNLMGNTNGQWSSYLSGGFTVQQYTLAAQNAYQERQLTIGAVNFPRYIQIGVHVDSTNASEGYWMKNPEIFFDKPYINSSFATANSGSGPRYFSGFGIRNTFTQLITRLSGRIN